MRLNLFLRGAGLAGLAAAALSLLSAPAQAGVFGFNFSGTCAEACMGNAVITTSAGQIKVVLTDTQANPRSAGDLISNLEFSTSSGTGSPTLGSQTGSLITVTSNTGPYTITGGPPTHWEVGTSGSQIVLDAFGGPMAQNLIIGPPDGSGNYSNANSSITNGTHSPYINGVGTFIIDDAAITSATTISMVTFSLGTMLNEFTQPGSSCTPGAPNCGSGPPILPEPASLALLGGALAMLGLWRRRRPN